MTDLDEPCEGCTRRASEMGLDSDSNVIYLCAACIVGLTPTAGQEVLGDERAEND